MLIHKHCLESLVLFCVIFVLLQAAGCATPKNLAVCPQEEVVVIDSFQEVQIGRAMAEEVIKKEYPLWPNPAKQLFVNKIGQKIVQACGRGDIVYHFAILDSPDLNAFALPGGYVYIYRGLFEKIDEIELAAIIAHEVGHVEARHAVTKMQAELGYKVMAGLVFYALGEKDPRLSRELPRLRGLVFEALSKGYGREDEFLADNLAVAYLQSAGYDPNGLARALELLEMTVGPGGRAFEISSTRPVMQERVKRIKNEVEKDENVLL